MILLDTHVVLWMLTNPTRLSRRVHDALMHARSAEEKIGFSPISLYKLTYAARRKRLPLTTPTIEFMAAIQAKLELVPVSAEIAICAAELPDSFHGDPMDRIITATAIVSDCTLITHDDRIRKANLCKVLW